MERRLATRENKVRIATAYVIELLVYGGVVGLYYWVVLQALRGWLKHLFDGDKAVYAAAALGIILGQAVLLELVTAGLSRILRGRTK